MDKTSLLFTLCKKNVISDFHFFSVIDQEDREAQPTHTSKTLPCSTPVVTVGSGGNLNKAGARIDFKGGGRAETTQQLTELSSWRCVCVCRSTDGGGNGRAGGGGKGQAARRRLEWSGPSTVPFPGTQSLGLRGNSWVSSEGLDWACKTWRLEFSEHLLL